MDTKTEHSIEHRANTSLDHLMSKENELNIKAGAKQWVQGTEYGTKRKLKPGV